MPWTHPTGNQPKIVTLVCLGTTRNTYAAACLEDDLSEHLQGVDEIWTLNRGVTLFRHDLVFVMDHLGGEADRFPRYGAALWRHDKPIITSDDCDGWPAHVHRYPLAEIWEWLRVHLNPMHGDWWHNSVAYILAYAAFIGVKELRVFGADYSHHNSGIVEDGHPNVAYWVGKLEAAGLVTRPCGDSHFLNCAQRGWMYGYRDDPRRVPAARGRFRALTGQAALPESIALHSGERQVAPTLDQIQPDHVARYRWAASQVAGTVLDCGGGIGYGAALLVDEQPNITRIRVMDRSGESLRYAAQHYARPAIEWLDMDLAAGFAMPRADAGETFDWALAFELIEHLVDPRPFLTTLPASRLLASVPNEAVIPYSPATAPFHHRHYTRDQFAALLADCGWTILGWHGQTSPTSPVGDWTDACRTLIVEAQRCPLAVSSSGKATAGPSPDWRTHTIWRHPL